ncbi:hypothetical protein DL546_004872 [Coniochaeta pulveracea]|uniref:Uncharacterized protein n=1 Tax=Coniochaeta pulveracea TaxID=177199 RepID=A0A420Y5H4_9PEZI|nr:hypothetical protein DL546_004872 [Coniochaeta pulveracea]
MVRKKPAKSDSVVGTMGAVGQLSTVGLLHTRARVTGSPVGTSVTTSEPNRRTLDKRKQSAQPKFRIRRRWVPLPPQPAKRLLVSSGSLGHRVHLTSEMLPAAAAAM